MPSCIPCNPLFSSFFARHTAVLARVQAFLPQMSAANERLQHSSPAGKDMCCVEIVPQTESNAPPPQPAAPAARKARTRPRGSAQHRRPRGSAPKPEAAAQKPYVLMNVLVANPDAAPAQEKPAAPAAPAAKTEAPTGLAAMQQEIARGMRGAADAADGTSDAAAHLDGMTDEEREAMLLQLFALQNNLELAQQRQQERDSEDDDDDSSESDSDSSESDSESSESDSGQEAMDL